MTSRHRSAPDRRPGDGLVAAGAGLFVLGAVALLADVLPYFFSRPDRPLWLNIAAFLAPLGLGIALLGLLRQSLAARRRAGAARDRVSPPLPPG